MANSSQEQVAAAEGYEDLLVPALCQTWISTMLDTAQIQPGQRILDIACGTGVLARHALKRVEPDGLVSGIDPSQGMLELAMRLEPRVDWHQGNAESLPFADDQFDAAISQFGFMFFTNPSDALMEMRRVLRDDGCVAIAVWDSLEVNQAYSIEIDILNKLAGDQAADAVRLPFAMGDRDKFLDLLFASNISSPAVETLSKKARFPSIRSMVEVDLKGWLPMMGINLTEETMARIITETELALKQFIKSDGQLEFEMSAHIFSGSK